MTQITNDMLTDWFPPHIKPARRGVFETIDESGAHWLSHWGGAFWGWGVRLEGVACGAWPRVPKDENEDDLPAFQDRPWRGLNREV